MFSLARADDCMGRGTTPFQVGRGGRAIRIRLGFRVSLGFYDG